MEKEAVKNMQWLADSMINNFPGCIIRVVYTKEKMWMEYISEGAERIFGETPKEYMDKINNILYVNWNYWINYKLYNFV